MDNEVYIRALKFAYKKQDTGFTWTDIQSELTLNDEQMNWLQSVLRSNMPIANNLVDHIYESGKDNTLLFLTSKGIAEAIKYTQSHKEKENTEDIFDETKGYIVPKTPDWIAWLAWAKRFFERICSKERGGLSFKKCSITFLVLCLLAFTCYTILIKDTSHFAIEMQGQSFQARDNSTPTVVDLWLVQKITNISEDERYLEYIHYVLWRNELLGRTWAYGYGMGDIYVINGSEREKISLPILFRPNEVKTIALSVEVQVSDKDTFAFLAEKERDGVFSWTKNSFDALLEDSRGNIFDDTGKLISQSVTDTWWVFPNNRSFKDRLMAGIDLFWKIAKWKTGRLLHYIS